MQTLLDGAECTHVNWEQGFSDVSLYNLISAELILGDIKKLTGQTVYFQWPHFEISSFILFFTTTMNPSKMHLRWWCAVVCEVPYHTIQTKKFYLSGIANRGSDLENVSYPHRWIWNKRVTQWLCSNLKDYFDAYKPKIANLVAEGIFRPFWGSGQNQFRGN